MCPALARVGGNAEVDVQRPATPTSDDDDVSCGRVTVSLIGSVCAEFGHSSRGNEENFQVVMSRSSIGGLSRPQGRVGKRGTVLSLIHGLSNLRTPNF